MGKTIEAPRARVEKAAPRVNAADHDLPLLAAGAYEAPHPNWASLLDEGVQPCLVLGAERRQRGPR